MDPHLVADLDRARAELRATMAEARAALRVAQVRMAPTHDELERLQEDARSGLLGRHMQTLAAHVANGDTTWLAVFDGTSPHKHLLRSHLTAMGEQYADSVRRALVDDPHFDPAAGSPGV